MINAQDKQAELEAIEELRAEALLEAITSTCGKLFAVEFTKKDGSIRNMTCRLGVKKGVKGTRPEATAKRKETLKKNFMIGVYEMKNQEEGQGAFRTVNAKTIRKFKCGEFEIDYTQH